MDTGAYHGVERQDRDVIKRQTDGRRGRHVQSVIHVRAKASMFGLEALPAGARPPL
jgi:hypothetical protein